MKTPRRRHRRAVITVLLLILGGSPAAHANDGLPSHSWQRLRTQQLAFAGGHQPQLLVDGRRALVFGTYGNSWYAVDTATGTVSQHSGALNLFRCGRALCGYAYDKVGELDARGQLVRPVDVGDHVMGAVGGRSSIVVAWTYSRGRTALVGIDRKARRIVWRKRTPVPSDLVVAGRYVVYRPAANQLQLLELKTGRTLAPYQAAAQMLGLQTSDRSIVELGRRTLITSEIASGKRTVLRLAHTLEPGQLLLLSASSAYALTGKKGHRKRLVRIDRQRGSLAFSVRLKTREDQAQLFLHRGWLHLLSSDTLYVLDAQTGQLTWQWNTAAKEIGFPNATGVSFVLHHDGRLEVFGPSRASQPMQPFVLRGRIALNTRPKARFAQSPVAGLPCRVGHFPCRTDAAGRFVVRGRARGELVIDIKTPYEINLPQPIALKEGKRVYDVGVLPLYTYSDCH
ncbi:MAG: PQQ-binding-like beta-propeller repeat protein [Deltaproteobacteria bacterium]|nr:PQQ-binding-like beta-propeller repeat protein [Deltaproteobacteria bacterium]